jgi:hypothetical protein
LAQAVTVIVDVVRVVMIVVLPSCVFVVVAGQTVVVVYVVIVVVLGHRASRTLAMAVVAKAKIAKVVLILYNREYSWERVQSECFP